MAKRPAKPWAVLCGALRCGAVRRGAARCGLPCVKRASGTEACCPSGSRVENGSGYMCTCSPFFLPRVSLLCVSRHVVGCGGGARRGGGASSIEEAAPALSWMAWRGSPPRGELRCRVAMRVWRSAPALVLGVCGGGLEGSFR